MNKSNLCFAGILLSVFWMVADSTAVGVPPPQAAGPEDVRAVMFLVTIDRKTGVWTHAQVIGGYRDRDACTRSMATARAVASPNLAPGDVPIFFCPNIDSRMVEGEINEDDSDSPAQGDTRSQSPIVNL
jgi:hypothetical protein